MKIIHLDKCASTNDEARKYEGDTIIIAREQSLGRGTHERSFSSIRDNGFYGSFVFDNLDLPVEYSGHITLGTAGCVHDAIFELYGIKTDVKWINDLMLDGKKVSGILSEGINFETQNMPIHGPFFVPDITSRDGYFESFKNRKASEVFSGTKLKKVVIGIGINLGRKPLPEEIKSIATSLSVCDEVTWEILDRLAGKIYEKLKEVVSIDYLIS